jgi:tape measure domain-containing protein
MPQENISILIDAVNKASKEIQQVSKDLGGMGKSAKTSQKSMTTFSQGLKSVGGELRGLGTAITATVTLPLALLGKTMLNQVGQMEQFKVALDTMLGGAEEGSRILKDLALFAAKTPFDLPGVVQAGKQLLAFGIETDKLLPTVKALGDVAAGTGAELQRIILNFGQVATQGKLTGRELRDFAVLGVPLISELAKEFGVAKNEVQDLVSAGKVGFPEVDKAFQNMTGEGGRFFDLMDKQSKTLKGIISNLRDNFVRVSLALFGLSSEANNFGEIIEGGVFDVLKTIAQGALEVLDRVVVGLNDMSVGSRNMIVIMTGFAIVVGPIILLMGAFAAALAALTAPIAIVVLALAALGAAITAVFVHLHNVNMEWDKWVARGEAFIANNEKLIESYGRLSDVLGIDIPDSLIQAGEAVKQFEIDVAKAVLAREKALKEGDKAAAKSAAKQLEIANKQLKEAKAILKEEERANASTGKEIFQDTARLAQLMVDIGEEELKRRVELLNARGAANTELNRQILFGEQNLTDARIAEIERLEARITAFTQPVTKLINVQIRTQADSLTQALFGTKVTEAFSTIKTQFATALERVGNSAQKNLAGTPAKKGKGGGLGGAAKSAKKDIEDLREELDDMRKDLSQLSNEFRRDVAETSNAIQSALGGELIAIEKSATNYESLQEGVEGVQDAVTDLIDEHNDFIEQANEGIEKYKDKIQTLREEAIEDVIVSFNDALRDQIDIQEELKEAEDKRDEALSKQKADVSKINEEFKKRREELEEEEKVAEKIIADFNELTKGAMDFSEALEMNAEKIQKVKDEIAALAEIEGEEVPLDKLEKQQEALAAAERERLVLIGKQILATEELEKLQKQQAEKAFIADLSDIEQIAFQLAKEEEAANAAIALLEQQKIDENRIFEEKLMEQAELLEGFKQEEVTLAENTAEELNRIQLELESNLTLSYDRMIEKLKELEKAANAAFEASQRAGVTGAFAGGQFAGGGYTGAGSIKDIAGVVHKGEWVAPNWMVRTFRPMFSQLENMRKNKSKGFAEGGEVGGKTFNQPITMNNNISSAVDFAAVGSFLKFQLRGI